MEIGKFAISATLSEDRTSLIVEVSEGGEVVQAGSLDATALDRLILALAVGRAEMAEQVAPQLAEQFDLRCIEGPAVRVPEPLADGSKILALRHPGFGWLGFRMEPERAKALAAAMLDEKVAA
jgi:hypothetical protein